MKQRASCMQAGYLTMLRICCMHSWCRHALCWITPDCPHPIGAGMVARAPCGTSFDGRIRRRCGTT